MKNKLKNIKKKYWIAGLIVILIIIVLAIRGNSEKNTVTYSVQRQDVADAITLAGTIDVENRVDLGFASAGRVSSVYVKEGESVKKGQVIAQIDLDQLQAGLSQARANKVITQADVQSDSTATEINLDAIQAQQDQLVNSAYTAYLSGDLQAYLDGTTSRDIVAPVISGTYLGQAEGEYVIDVYHSSSPSGYSFRVSGLGDGTYSAQTTLPGKLAEEGLYILFDDSSNYGRTTWIVPVPNTRSSTYVTRKTAYENAIATRKQVVSAAQNELNKVRASVDDFSRSEAEVQRAQAEVTAVYAQINDGRIIAPFDGIVARNDLEVGQIVSAYDGLVTLFGSTQRELKLNVPEIYINKLEVGDTVEVTLDAYPDETFTGTVETIDIIDTIVDGVPVYETRVLIDNQDPRIRVGMNAKGTVTSDRRIDVLAIPQHYVLEQDGKTSVLVRTEAEVIEQPVELGFYGNDGLVEVASGLDEGDIIVRPATNTD